MLCLAVRFSQTFIEMVVKKIYPNLHLSGLNPTLMSVFLSYFHFPTINKPINQRDK
jgi:hypothetical protein